MAALFLGNGLADARLNASQQALNIAAVTPDDVATGGEGEEAVGHGLMAQNHQAGNGDRSGDGAEGDNPKYAEAQHKDAEGGETDGPGQGK